MSKELEALEQAANSLYRGIARLRTQQGVDNDKRMAKLGNRVDELEDKIAALGLAENTYATAQAAAEVFIEAIDHDRTVTFTYTDAQGSVTSRVVSPYDTDRYGLIVAYDHDREAMRRFDPDRAVILEVGAADFVDPA